ncbi:hypothetical protein CEXT_645831 [Caerostris extrusa]|uniref:Uncharacterized protein n=1 Tax=Caerostris extrusa TaxID=172846 RepID=A0AAV4MFC3_CAEEX|nr:hypothetical protein CEXT_645831 [Caerostris extrusa]
MATIQTRLSDLENESGPVSAFRKIRLPAYLAGIGFRRINSLMARSPLGGQRSCCRSGGMMDGRYHCLHRFLSLEQKELATFSAEHSSYRG